MAQTIALQRGSGTVTGNGSSYLNFFTQSTGTATRVILNGVSGYSSGSDYNILVGIFVKSAGSTTNVHPMAVKGFPGNSLSASTFDFSPMTANNNNYSIGTNSGPTGANGALAVASSAGTPSATTFGMTLDTNIYVFTAQGGSTNLAGTYGMYDATAPNFWIGPSDVVCLKVYGANTRTWTVSYSFTTVTES